MISDGDTLIGIIVLNSNIMILCLQIQDPNQVYDAINLGRRIDVVWPDEKMRARGGRSSWRDWLPEKGMEGQVNTDIVCTRELYNINDNLHVYLFLPLFIGCTSMGSISPRSQLQISCGPNHSSGKNRRQICSNC